MTLVVVAWRRLPVDNGYIGRDGVHLSDKGRAVQVDVLDALGYEAVNP